jgi:hypothetical protein
MHEVQHHHDKYCDNVGEWLDMYACLPLTYILFLSPLDSLITCRLLLLLHLTSLLDPSQHNPNAQSQQAVQKLSIYVIETARMMLRPPTETISVLFDMSNFSMSNMVSTIIR